MEYSYIREKIASFNPSPEGHIVLTLTPKTRKELLESIEKDKESKGFYITSRKSRRNNEQFMIPTLEGMIRVNLIEGDFDAVEYSQLEAY